MVEFLGHDFEGIANVAESNALFAKVVKVTKIVVVAHLQLSAERRKAEITCSCAGEREKGCDTCS